MDYNDFSVSNKSFFASNIDWQQMLSKLQDTKHFFDELGFITFGRDMNVIRSDKGLLPVYTNGVLQSVAQTLQSMIACAEYGNLADTQILLRKFRDDLFFYLYVIAVCKDGDLFSTNPQSQQEKYVNAWVENRLSHLNIGRVISEIIKADECAELVKNYGLKAELQKIGRVLNNYTHGNGGRYYNRLYTHYTKEEICSFSKKTVHMVDYISITFIFLLILLQPGYIMATDFVDALDFSMAPAVGSQYWVVPFVSQFVEERKTLLGKSALEYLRENTNMEI